MLLNVSLFYYNKLGTDCKNSVSYECLYACLKHLVINCRHLYVKYSACVILRIRYVVHSGEIFHIFMSKLCIGSWVYVVYTCIMFVCLSVCLCVCPFFGVFLCLAYTFVANKHTYITVWLMHKYVSNICVGQWACVLGYGSVFPRVIVLLGHSIIGN